MKYDLLHKNMWGNPDQTQPFFVQLQEKPCYHIIAAICSMT